MKKDINIVNGFNLLVVAVSSAKKDLRRQKEEMVDSAVERFVGNAGVQADKSTKALAKYYKEAVDAGIEKLQGPVANFTETAKDIYFKERVRKRREEDNAQVDKILSEIQGKPAAPKVEVVDAAEKAREDTKKPLEEFFETVATSGSKAIINSIFIRKAEKIFDGIEHAKENVASRNDLAKLADKSQQLADNIAEFQKNQINDLNHRLMGASYEDAVLITAKAFNETNKKSEEVVDEAYSMLGKRDIDGFYKAPLGILDMRGQKVPLEKNDEED